MIKKKSALKTNLVSVRGFASIITNPHTSVRSYYYLGAQSNKIAKLCMYFAIVPCCV